LDVIKFCDDIKEIGDTFLKGVKIQEKIPGKRE